mgnify:CR=1 FL=1
MKILFLGGNLASDLADWMTSQGEEVIYREDKVTTDDVKKVSPDFIISYNYKYIISKEIIDCVRGKAVNLHISLLPWNRGSHPNVWSFLGDTPKGVTIHYINDGIGTGDVILQKEVFIDENKETLKSSYEILHREIQSLFKENWDKIKNGEIVSQKQMGGGTCTTRGNVLNSSPSSKERDGILQSENSKDSIADGNLIFRNADKNDAVDIFKWRNHPDVRKNSFNTNPILWEEHEKWFKKKLAESDIAIYTVCCRDKKIGAIRFEDKGEAVKVNIMLNPDFLGKGFGSKIIRLGTEKFIKERQPDKSIHAEIKKDNIASIRAFQKAGYKESHLTFIYPYE